MTDRRTLIRHLRESGLAGQVQTSVRETKANSLHLLDGDPRHTLGLSDWRNSSMADITTALWMVAGATLDVTDEEEGFIDPENTVAGLDRHARGLSRHLSRGKSKILIATGHPTGLLEHYLALGRELEKQGNALLTVPDDGPSLTPANDTERARTIRFIGPVACVYDGLSLVHSHLSAYMESMLDALGEEGHTVDLVIADHGMAGAAVERGIPTLSIADINDPALPLAHYLGRHEGVAVIDDNLPPRLFRPVTRYILEQAYHHAGGLHGR